jgi:hypothetical protein
MKLVHSFHYFEETVKIKNGRIVDLKTGNVIQVLTNLFRDREIFTPIIEKVLSKKKSLQNYRRFFNNRKVNCNICYNTKVVIDININNLIKAIKNNNFHDRGVFFLLVNRNLSNCNKISKETFMDDILNKNNSEIQNSIDINYFGNQIVQLGELFLDLENQLVYFNHNDIVRNKFKLKLPNTRILFTDNDEKISNVFNKNTIFSLDNQNLIIYDSKIIHVQNIINKYNISNYVILNDDNINEITYCDIVSKTLLVDYQCLSFKYKSNIIANCLDFKDTTEAFEVLIQRYIYETKFMNREDFLNLNNVLIHSLVFDNVIIFDFRLNELRSMNNMFVNNFKYKNAYFVSNKFLEYNIDTIFYKLKSFFTFKLESELSKDLAVKFLKNIFIDDYSNLKKEKSILFEYSKQELDIIENTETKKNEKISLPIFFPIKKLETCDLKHINNNTCSICLEKLKPSNTVKTSCNHYFCYQCSIIHTENKNKVTCPLCRNPLDKKKDFTQLITKPKSLPGKVGKIVQNITNNSLIVSNYNENLHLLSNILQNCGIEFKEVTLINRKIVNNSKDFTKNKTVIFLENNVDKYTRYLYKNSEIKVLVPIREVA